MREPPSSEQLSKAFPSSHAFGRFLITLMFVKSHLRPKKWILQFEDAFSLLPEMMAEQQIKPSMARRVQRAQSCSEGRSNISSHSSPCLHLHQDDDRRMALKSSEEKPPRQCSPGKTSPFLPFYSLVAPMPEVAGGEPGVRGGEREPEKGN